MPSVSGYRPIEFDRNGVVELLQSAMCVILCCACIIVALYLFVIVLALLQVAFHTIFERTMIFLLGKHAYAVNFPICTATVYNGDNCYTAVSTYCT